MNNKYKKYEPAINNIVDSLRKQQLSVFCGAGATQNTTNVGWNDLFKAELAVMDKENIHAYRLAEYYELHFGKSKLQTVVANLFSDTKNEKHIEKLLKLPIYDFWTTNFDCIIEQMIKEDFGFEPSVIYNSENIIKINENRKYKVFKLNGSIADLNSMILTESDYARYKYKQTILIESLKRSLILNTFIFIGYSFNDNLILDCLNEIKNYFPSLSHYHYRFEKKINDNPVFQEAEKSFFENNYNIKTIYIDDFEEIDDLLDIIYNEYSKKNVYISGSFRNLSPKEEDFANEICKLLVESLIEEDFNIYSGDGKRLGSYVISNATKKLMNHRTSYQNRLNIMPYIDHTFKGKSAYDLDRKTLIKKMLKDCSVSIFMYGQSEDGKISEGVMAEYEEARKKKMLLIPIPVTGFAAQNIANKLESEGLPGYLEGYWNSFAKEDDPKKIVKTIMEILSLSINNT